MKKVLFVILCVFPALCAFPQTNANEAINFGFENRKKEGYYNITQMGMLMGNRKITEQTFYVSNTRTQLQFSPSVTMTNGVLINNWAIGIGVGFEIYDHNLFPLFADVRYHFNDSRASPFFALKAGHSFGNFRKKHYDNMSLDYEPYFISDVDFKNYGGLMLQPEMGVKIPLSEKVDILFTVAYRRQKMKTKVTPNSNWYNHVWKHEEAKNRLSFNMAFMFR